MPRLQLPGDEGDSFEGELFRPGRRPGTPVRGEIGGDSTTPHVRGCFGLTPSLASALQIPSSDWWLFIGPNELRRLRLTNLRANPAGPLVIFEAELDAVDTSNQSVDEE